MIKRLQSFIRHMREPTFNDPKASRWADAFQKRARYTGQLPEADVLQKMGIPADNPFWKQDNASPNKGFAVNVKVPIATALRALSPEEIAVDARDDFGRKVDMIPLAKTGTDYYFDPTSACFHLDHSMKSISPSVLAWTVARGFKVWMLLPDKYPTTERIEDASAPESDPEAFAPDNHILTRFTWDSRRKAWYILTEHKEA